MCVCMNDLWHYFCSEMRDNSSQTEHLLDLWLQTSGCELTQDLVGPQSSHKCMLMIYLRSVHKQKHNYNNINNQLDATITVY